jgi:hypothetical protein
MITRCIGVPDRGYPDAVTTRSKPTDPPDRSTDPDSTGRHPVLESFNAEGVVEHPDEPDASAPEDAADDAAAPPPG